MGTIPGTRSRSTESTAGSRANIGGTALSHSAPPVVGMRATAEIPQCSLGSSSPVRRRPALGELGIDPGRGLRPPTASHPGGPQWVDRDPAGDLVESSRDRALYGW